jgi:glyoxalase family protein
MTIETPGLHHVTSIASDPQRNVECYTDVLGLRLVKRTVNFDEPGTYHLYYGDEVGHPGTVLTFFPFGGGSQGRVGRGQASATAFVIPEDALDYWLERLDEHGLDVDEPLTRFGETVVPFRDHDGQPLELVTGTSDIEPWADGPVPEAAAIRGFHSVTLDSLDPDRTAAVLEALGYERDRTEGNRTRYRTDGERATAVDIVGDPETQRGRSGAGTVHHVAFRVPDEETQLEWRDRLADLGMRVTPQKDRQYFKSIYFREPGGILIEIATDGPGFTRDESVDDLGTALQLPPWLEDDRDALETQLPDLDSPPAETQR